MFVAQSQPMKRERTVEVMQTAQRQVGSSHSWLLKEAREPARWVSGRKRTPEAGVRMMFNEKQVGQGGWSEKRGEWQEGTGFGYHSEGSRKPSEGAEQKSSLDIEDDALTALETVSRT